uniref:Uncharacterized protein n=1 Tax=Ascaris lumbricoides TaxID=6252 RepID=A0A9J2PU68_ASCLU
MIHLFFEVSYCLFLISDYNMSNKSTLLRFSLRDEPTEFVEKRDVNNEGIEHWWPGKDGECTDDALVITELLRDYDKFKLPGGSNVQVSVEVC